jgi:hypothetical protein
MTKLEQEEQQMKRFDSLLWDNTIPDREQEHILTIEIPKLRKRIRKLRRESLARDVKRKIKNTDFTKEVIRHIAKRTLKSHYAYNNTLISMATHRIEIAYIEPENLIGMYYVTNIHGTKRLSKKPYPLYNRAGQQTEIDYLYNRVTNKRLFLKEDGDLFVNKFLEEFAKELGIEVVFVFNRQYGTIEKFAR